MHQAISAATDFQPIHFETFADHYAKTLSLWRNQFERNLSQIRQLAVERQVDVCQLVLAKPECRALIEVPALPCCPLAKDESN
jgi:cyclopropane fatty-acyl-phospholipid synthase-like methyltransferase